jgi:hypothetical protein
MVGSAKSFAIITVNSDGTVYLDYFPSGVASWLTISGISFSAVD